MKVVIVFTGLNENRPRSEMSSLALQRVAGNNVLGHILNQLKDVEIEELTVIVDKDLAAVASWLDENKLGYAAASVISTDDDRGLWQLLTADMNKSRDDELLIVSGGAIVEANYRDLGRTTADVTLIAHPRESIRTPEEESAGALFFRHRSDLWAVLDSMILTERQVFTSIQKHLPRHSLHVEVQEASMWLDARSEQGLLAANRGLLGLGYGSENAIERSYLEDFTVVPPVFLHDSAVIESAIIGPFVNVEAGAEIYGSVIRNSLIGEQSVIENMVLDGSVIGARARVQSSGRALIVDADAEISLDHPDS